MDEEKENPRRLCSEIQLFDICAKEACKLREGRFCTDPEMLAKFEGIREDEEISAEGLIDEESDEMDELDDDGYGEDVDTEYDEEDEDDW